MKSNRASASKRALISTEELGGLTRDPVERMAKEEKPMLKDLSSPPLKTDNEASTQQTDRLDDEKPVSKPVSRCSSRGEETGRERLKRHRVEMAGQVWIPDVWGQENFLHDWIDSSVFDAALGPKEIMSARASLVEEGRRAHSGSLSC